LLAAILTSTLRLVVGFVVSTTLSLLLGLMLYSFPAVNRFVGPLFLGLQTLPSVCWAPLAILLLGSNEPAILFVMVMGSTFAVSLSFRDGLRTIPPLYTRAGLMLGATGPKLLQHVLLPASLPALSSSLRQSFSFTWRSLLGAEFIFDVYPHGLGFMLQSARHLNDIPRIATVMALMVTIGILADRLCFGPLEHRIHTHFGLANTA
jgi:NitT/TauT family transport system permease protein